MRLRARIERLERLEVKLRPDEPNRPSPEDVQREFGKHMEALRQWCRGATTAAPHSPHVAPVVPTAINVATL